jgi:protein tyrosine/serine phosphatase
MMEILNVFTLRTRRVFLPAAKGILLGLLLVAVSIGSYCGIIQYLGNIHVVKEGVLYRSAQLDRAEFEKVISRYRIKSILNLRGASRGQSWYEDEISTAVALQVVHFDYGISEGDVISAGQVNEILEIVRRAPRPILVHCLGGADRTGLVSALFLAELEKRPASEAARQLSLMYGHFPFLTSKTGAMDQSFWDYVHANSVSRRM